MGTEAGISRRQLIKRGAVAGGAVVWAAPVVQSFTSPAFGQVAGSPAGSQDISFVALLVNCGGTTFRIKFEAPFPPGTIACGNAAVESGRNFAVAGCLDQLRKGETAVSNGCPPGVTATFNSSTGELTVNTGSCAITDFVVKCGVPSDPDDSGCVDPGEEPQQPVLPASGSVTFTPCVLGDTTPGIND